MAGAPVWDPALRAFHWALAGFVTASWLLGEFGPGIMTWHFRSGYAIAGLLVFRLLWGVIGPETARFAAFLRGPGAVMAYARTLGRRAPSRWPGHNPLGGWAVAAMLLVLAAQVATGLFADPEDYINQGPLAALVPREWRLAASGYHKTGALLIAGLVALHLAAILFYRLWKGEDLVTPMIRGRRD